MATLDELQAQLAALTQRVNEITAPPDDYYTHRFSGEEIDNAVDRVEATSGSGAITAGDIGAAPGGFGLGDSRNIIDSWDNALENGFYVSNGNAPDDGDYAHGVVLSNGGVLVAQIASPRNNPKCLCVRTKSPSGFGSWEWLNPPMVPGVEYRTTKRRNKQPVYAQLIIWGNLPNNTIKSGSFGIAGLNGLVSCQLQFANSSDLIPYDNPNNNQKVIVRYVSTYNGGTVAVETNYDASGLRMWANVEYTKAT